MDIEKFCEENNYYLAKYIEGIGWCALNRFVFTVGLIIGMDEYGYFGRYCYSNNSDAMKAITNWDGLGDPPGNWIKYKGKGGERNNPNYKIED